MNRHYVRPDGVQASALVSMALTCWADGTVTGSFSAWAPNGERARFVRLPQFSVEGTVAPPGVEALAEAGQLVLDLWGAGKVPS